jgi:diguanylate cyclase (GGDEF)-like protein
MDIRMPPGIDGIEAAKQIRKLDPNVNIVLVTGSFRSDPEDLGNQIPPADKIFFFKKPFHAVECRQLAAALCGKWHADLALRKVNEMLEQRVAERTSALHKLAYYDPLTKLPNRLRSIDELQSMIGKADGPDLHTAVVLLDIERFSFLNETIGYDFGTELLKSIATRLAELMTDIAGTGSAVVGRFGDDEFACLISGIADENALHVLAEQIRSKIEEPFVVGGRDLFLKSSIGVSWHPAHGRDAQAIFRGAEAALHRAKRKTGPGITFYKAEMQHRARHKFSIESELRQAISSGQIGAYFQPQLRLSTGQTAGAEALARWIRPDGSIISPSDFIPLSEEMGIIDGLFESVLNFVCESLSQWRKESDWDIPISVNLSPHQLRNPKLLDHIRQILTEHNIDQKLINVELTETMLLEDFKLAHAALTDLSEYGLDIHIDDFGTGYSSLSYLVDLPVRTLKVDRSFVARLTESRTDARFFQAILGVAKAIDLDVIAEGVETQEQFVLLEKFGCDLAQGFFIAEPMPRQEFHAWCTAEEDHTNVLRTMTLVAEERKQPVPQS